jgi:hypothetical protein
MRYRQVPCPGIISADRRPLGLPIVSTTGARRTLSSSRFLPRRARFTYPQTGKFVYVTSDEYGRLKPSSCTVTSYGVLTLCQTVVSHQRGSRTSQTFSWLYNDRRILECGYPNRLSDQEGARPRLTKRSAMRSALEFAVNT